MRQVFAAILLLLMTAAPVAEGVSRHLFILSGQSNMARLDPAHVFTPLLRAALPGDQVIVYTQQRQYIYVVDRTAIVEPTAVEVMAPTGNPTATLISCYPYLVNDQRIVVFARLQN